ncbi:MAG: chromophore lyase CpcT/CpeT [Chitinophagaceae bacterium]
MKKLLIIISLLATGYSLFSQKLGKKDLLQLKTFMQGNFSTAQQSKMDTAFLSISLHMKQVWPQRNDGYWLYVEQAATETPDKPYRQRMYHLYLQDDSILVSQVFEFKDPARFIGYWNEPKRFDSIKFFVLSSRAGCEVYLRKNSQGKFTGSTEGKDCQSSLRGASYATSEVLIDKMNIHSWDRGWNADNLQVWGSVKGPYQFKKSTK